MLPKLFYLSVVTMEWKSHRPTKNNQHKNVNVTKNITTVWKSIFLNRRAWRVSPVTVNACLCFFHHYEYNATKQLDMIMIHHWKTLQISAPLIPERLKIRKIGCIQFSEISFLKCIVQVKQLSQESATSFCSFIPLSILFPVLRQRKYWEKYCRTPVRQVAHYPHHQQRGREKNDHQGFWHEATPHPP